MKGMETTLKWTNSVKIQMYLLVEEEKWLQLCTNYSS